VGSSISPPGVPRALVGLVFDFVAKWIKKWFCEILDDPWSSRDQGIIIYIYILLTA
jgi:hypothetical protein